MPADADFDDFYRASARRLVGELTAITGNTHEAEDIVQEAFVRAWDRWEQLRGFDAPYSWLRLVAVNLSRNRLRRARRQLAALVRHGPPADVPELSPDELAVLQALQHLPQRYREVLALYHLSELSVAEVAALVHAPVGTVKARLARGRRALAQQFSEPGDALPEEVAHGR